MLVGQKETCKVTDFGMARDVQQENIYERKTKVPGNQERGEAGLVPHIVQFSDLSQLLLLLC